MGHGRQGGLKITKNQKTFLDEYLIDILWLTQKHENMDAPSEIISPNCAVYNISFLLFFQSTECIQSTVSFSSISEAEELLQKQIEFFEIA